MLSRLTCRGLDGNYIHQCIGPRLRNRFFPPPLFTRQILDGKYRDKGSGKVAPSEASVTRKSRQVKLDPGSAGSVVAASGLSATIGGIFGSFTAGRKSPAVAKQKGVGRNSVFESQPSSNQAAAGHPGTPTKEEGSEPGTPHSGQIAASYSAAEGSPRGRQLAGAQRAHSACLDSQARQGSPSPMQGPFWRPASYMGQQAPGPELGLPMVRTQHLQPAGESRHGSPTPASKWGGGAVGGHM